eukprot:m.357072 g.357072  ORF g.357072 m.357072 type:complete len:65 (+) comp17695_c0_seq1:13167-13361(+)
MELNVISSCGRGPQTPTCGDCPTPTHTATVIELKVWTVHCGSMVKPHKTLTGVANGNQTVMGEK